MKSARIGQVGGQVGEDRRRVWLWQAERGSRRTRRDPLAEVGEDVRVGPVEIVFLQFINILTYLLSYLLVYLPSIFHSTESATVTSTSGDSGIFRRNLLSSGLRRFV